jgi:hypothetical protein
MYKNAKYEEGKEPEKKKKKNTKVENKDERVEENGKI